MGFWGGGGGGWVFGVCGWPHAAVKTDTWVTNGIGGGGTLHGKKSGVFGGNVNGEEGGDEAEKSVSPLRPGASERERGGARGVR